MSNVGYATLTIIPSAKGFGSALGREVDAPMTGAGKNGGAKAGGAFVGAFKGLVGPAMAIAGAGIFSGFIAEAARASDATDKFKATMSFAGLKTPAIDAATKAAKEYADQTVFDLPTIQNTIAQLASNGIKDYTGLTKAAGNLNAVAGGNAETFKSVAMTMTQTAGAGKLTTENWNQLSDAIPGAAGPLMKAMEQAGAYTGNFREAMEKGKISSDEFNAALMKLGNQPVAVEAAKSTKTFEGAIGNLEATINSGLMGALNAMKPAITGAINLLANGLGGAFKEIGVGVTAFGSAWKANDGDVTSSGFPGFMERLANVARPVFDALAPLIPQVVSLASAFSPVGLILRSLEPVFPAIAGAVTTLASALSGVLSSALAAAGPLIGTLVSTLAGVFQAAMPAVTGMVTTLAGAFTEFAPVISSVLAAVLPLVTTLVSQLAPILINLITTVMPPIASIFGSIVTAIGPLVLMLADLLIPIIQALLPVVTTVFGVIAQVITAAMQIVQGIIQVVTGLISGNWDQVWTGIGNVLGGVWNLIVSLVTGAINLVGSIIGAGLNIIGSLWNSLWNGLIGFLAGAWNSIVSGVSGGIANVIGFFSGLWGRIQTAIGDITGNMLRIGGDIMRGLATGIGNAVGAVRDAIAGAVGNAIDFAKSLLGIHSPSRVFMEIGDYTAQGMAVGITKGRKHVTKAAKALVPPAPSFSSPDVEAGAASRAAAAAGTASGAPLVGQLTLQSSGDVREDLEETMFHLRRFSRGGPNA